jgi:subtilase family serine protease
MRLGWSSRGQRLTIASIGGAALLAASFGAAGSASAAAARHPLAHTKPQWLARGQRVGATSDTTKIDFGLLLGMRDQAGAEATLKRVSDPSSPDYGKWLSRSQFVAQHAPSAATASAVTGWLRSQGFTVRGTVGGAYVQASGSAKQIEKTFDTAMATYTLQGQKVQANTSELSLPADAPAAVAAAVTGVLGIDQGASIKKPATTLPGPPEGFRTGVQPCSAFFGSKIAKDQPAVAGKKQPYAVCGYTPQQYQGVYGETPLLKSGVTGKGVTVAITDAYAAPTILKDAQTYNQVHHQPLLAPGQFRQILPDSYNVTDPELAQGWYGEETLDVEAVHAMAPGAKLVFVAGKDQVSGLDEAWAQTIDSHVADIITDSWTFGDADTDDPGAATVDFFRYFSLEAALTGQTVLFSSGDSGDYTAGGTDPASKMVPFPSDLPYITSVGGTSVAVGAGNRRTGEWGWQSAYSPLSDDGTSWVLPGTYSSGGGGGTSQLFAQPFYQKGVVPARMADFYGTPARVTPDISAAGDPNTGFVVGETQEFPDGTYWDQYRIGGTSLSSPLTAGMLAVAAQKAHRPLGFVNPLLYGLRKSAIYDVVAPKKPVYQVRTDFANELDASEGYLFRLQSIDVQTSTIHSVPGYDDETGLGTPNGPSFYSALSRR